MRRLYPVLESCAQSDITVLLHGETGTGKGLLARAIHANSARRPRALDGDDARGAVGDPPFVHVDCTTLPAALVESELFGHERGAYTGADSRVIGKVEASDRGTLFLDEIGELPLPLQGKLLRFVQERQFERVGGRETLTADVRLVAATNRDLAAMVGAGQFRSDLYFRLRVVEIEIPPLRARGGDDIADLAAHFVDQFARRYRKAPLRLADAARPALAAYAWPGNVRELENTIERAVVLCEGPVLGVKDLGLEPHRRSGAFDVPAWSSSTALPGSPAADPAPPGPDGAEDREVRLPGNLALDEAERRYARAILERCDGNQSAAARLLGISRNKLARLLKA